MGHDRLPPINEGDALSATRENIIAELVGRQLTGPGATTTDAGFTVTRPTLPGALVFQNTSEEISPAYAVMAASNATRSRGKCVIQVAKPSATYSATYAVNARWEVPINGYGECVVAGECEALYDTGTPANGELWGPDNGVWGLRKGSVGDGASGTTILRADWGCIIVGVVDSVAKIVLVKIVPYGMAKRCTCLLAGAMASGDSTRTVDTIVVEGMGWCPVASASDTLTVYQTHGWRADDNAKATIVYNETTSRWEFEYVQQSASVLTGTLGGALTATTATQTVTSPAVMQPEDGTVPAGTITGYNVYTTKGFAGPSGGRCVVMWNKTTQHYEFIDVECT